jgi:hypothetical protein
MEQLSFQEQKDLWEQKLSSSFVATEPTPEETSDHPDGNPFLDETEEAEEDPMANVNEMVDNVPPPIQDLLDVMAEHMSQLLLLNKRLGGESQHLSAEEIKSAYQLNEESYMAHLDDFDNDMQALLEGVQGRFRQKDEQVDRAHYSLADAFSSVTALEAKATTKEESEHKVLSHEETMETYLDPQCEDYDGLDSDVKIYLRHIAAHVAKQKEAMAALSKQLEKTGVELARQLSLKKKEQKRVAVTTKRFHDFRRSTCRMFTCLFMAGTAVAVKYYYGPYLMPYLEEYLA